MKKPIFLFVFLVAGLSLAAQLKTTKVCPAFYVDILDGKVNDVRVTDNMAQIKEKFPCFTKSESESSTAKCGGGIYYQDKDLYFFTARDYVEIGPKFKGKMSLPLMGAVRGSLFKWLGHPKIKDVNWDAFTTQYGILILYYNKAKRVYKIQFSTKTAETIDLCE